MVKVENLKAVQGGKGTEIEYLGSLLWMSISNGVRIKYQDLEKELAEVGLQRMMPRKINPRDAFRRATKNIEVKREANGAGRYINLLVRPVKTDAAEMVRQLVREVVDGQNTRLEYKPVVQFEIKKDGNYAVIPLASDLSLIEQEAMRRLSSLYDEAVNTYEGDHIRRLVDRILNICSPVSVRPSGGVYFVPEKKAESMRSLKKLVQALAAYDKGSGTTRAWSIPVIDAQEHREMVEDSLEEQVINGSIAMIEEMKNLLNDPGQGITLSTIKQYTYHIKKMQRLVKEYEEMLDYQATKARENLDLAQKLAAKLMEKEDD